MRWAWPASVIAHAVVAALLLAPELDGPAPAPANGTGELEIELVQQTEQQQGAPAPGAAPDRPAPDAPASAPAPQQPPGPEAGAQPAPAPPAPAPPSPPPRAAPAAVHLGDADQDQEALSVTGDNVVPPAPDAVFRNKPPSYPPEAARRGAQGTVRLLIRVSAAGVPDDVVVAGSSGVAALDRAAREAALLWRFHPAMSGNTPVPFDYTMNIRFTNGGR